MVHLIVVAGCRRDDWSWFVLLDRFVVFVFLVGCHFLSRGSLQSCDWSIDVDRTKVVRAGKNVVVGVAGCGIGEQGRIRRPFGERYENRCC